MMRVAILVLLSLALPPSMFAFAAAENDDPIQQLVEQERIRTIVEDGFERLETLRRTAGDGSLFVRLYVDLVHELGHEDPAVVPLFANEMLQGNPATFFMAAYVLGMQGTPEAVEAILEGIKRADREGSMYAEQRKAHLIWTLAIAGDARAIELSHQGRHDVTIAGLHRSMSVLESAAILTQPDSLRSLHAELKDPQMADEERAIRIRQVIVSVGRVGDPSSVPVLLELLRHRLGRIRAHAADALKDFTGKSVVDALIAALDDEYERTVSAAAFSLLRIHPSGRFRELAAKLETVPHPTARHALLRLLGELDPKAALEWFASHYPGASARDRRVMIVAASRMGLPEGIDLLGLGVVERDDPALGAIAIDGLARIDSERARGILLQAIDSPAWPTAQRASTLAIEKRVPGAIDRVRHRLLEGELPGLVDNAEDRPRADWLLDLVAETLDVEAIDGLRRNLEVQRDGLLLEHLHEVLEPLETARENGDDHDKWAASTASESPLVRRAAYRYLGRSAETERAAEELAKAFGRVGPDEGAEILAQLERLPARATYELVERVLTAPEFLSSSRWDEQRDMAAWVARRIGGERMLDALATAVERREGRDARVLAYYALAAGKPALAALDRWIVPRMRFRQTTRGIEWDYLTMLRNRLRADKPLDFVDLPPGDLTFKLQP